MRLDKYLAKMTVLSRNEVAKAARKGRILINGEVVKSAKFNVDEDSDIVTLDGEDITFRENIYIMMNKPDGVICSTRDRQKTVLELLPIDVGQREPFSCGRLDKDTTGLVLLTDDGAWAHGITSPNRNCGKAYLVNSKTELTEKDIKLFENGFLLDEEEEKPTLPAILEKLDECYYKLIIFEGRYHQVKRMFEAVGNEVTRLHRDSIGELKLDPDLEEGDWRYLTEEEVGALRS